MKKSSSSFLLSCFLLLAFWLLNGLTLRAQNVVKVEYFLDNDPGFGKGTNVPVTPGADITSNFQVPINALADGFHNLYVRALVQPYQVTENNVTTHKGGWSLTRVRTLYKQGFAGGGFQSVNVVRGEYFIDTDPGFGQGTAIPVTPGAELSNVSFAIDVSALSNGFHNLHARFKDAEGRWSLTPVRTFYKQNLIPNGDNTPNLVKGEYFFDTDPGFGNGTNIPFAAGKDLGGLSFTADVSALNGGFHQLYARFKDANGQWGQTITRAFFKQTYTPAEALSDVVKLEYFIDSDPGHGNGTTVPLPPGKDISNLTFALNMEEISIGNHRIYVRAQDAKGAWSLVRSGSFKVDPPSELIITVGDLEPNLCAGGPVAVPFSVNSPFGSNNIFTAQLSNSSGSFTSPVNIGTLTGRANDTIHATIPANTGAGSGYRIRVIASSPFDTSAAGNAVLKISRVPEQGFSISGPTSVCLGTQSYSASSVEAGASLTWQLPAGTGTVDAATGVGATINWTRSGYHQMTVTANNACGAGTSRNHYVTVYGGVPKGKPTITQNGRTLTASTYATADSATGYQWYKDGVALTGATAATLSASGGNYTVAYTNPCGAGQPSNAVTIVFNENGYLVNGSAASQGNGCFLLTPNALWQAGSVWYQNYLNLNANFDFTFNLFLGTNNGGADGLAFVLQPLSTSAGSSGAGIGYGGLTPSLAVEYDTWQNDDPWYDHIAIHKNGNTVTSGLLVNPPVQASATSTNVEDGQWHTTRIVWNASLRKLTVYFDGVERTSYSGNIVADIFGGNNKVYWGFTAATGAASNEHKVCVLSTLYDELKKEQTITFQPVGGKTFGDAPFKVAATASSDLPVTYSLVSGPATLEGDLVTLTGAGTVKIRATQGGNDTLAVATSDLTIAVEKGAATISLSGLTTIYNGSAKKPVATTVPAGLQVTYTFNGSSTAPVAAGTYEVVATINNSNYTGSVTESFQVQKAPQTIALTSLPDQPYGNSTLKVKALAHASSGLPVAFSLSTSPEGIATISNDTLTITGPGSVIVIASQEGNDNYAAAPVVKDTLAVVAAPDITVLSVISGKPVVAPGEVVTVSWTVKNAGTGTAAVNWTERIYMQSPNGTNRTLLKQSVFATDGQLTYGESLPRNSEVTMPAQLNLGDEAVFVVELVPGALIKEAAGGAVNNIAQQELPWTISRLLTLELSANQLTEGAQGLTALVKRSGSIATPLTLNVTVGNSSRFSVPATVTIPAGQAGTSFALSAPDNTNVDGHTTDTLRISAAGFTAAKAGFALLDNDKASLSLTGLPASAMEGTSVTFTVATNLAPAQPLQVFLTSGNKARFPVPASVTIPAGALSTQVTVALDQDNTPEVDVEALITAGAADHNATTALIQVQDDDLPGLELIVHTNVVSESAGAFATQATLRRKAGSNNVAFTANLAAGAANTLLLPSAISLAAGENEKTFTIGVVDNSLVDGQREVAITAALFVNSCGCSAPSTSSGWVSAPLTISDNDGASLQVTATQLTLPEGSANAGYIRVTRNTATTAALTVNLTSSNTNEATVPATAVIPVGKAFVDVLVTTINDGVTDGNQQVYFQVSASGFSTGSLWLMVSDLNKPDLQLASVTLGKSTVQAMSIFNYQFAVKNSGAATAPTGVLVRGYLSKDDIISDDDTLISEDLLTVSIPAGQSVPVLNAVQAPNLPGAYKLLFWVNPDLDLTELLTTNNTSGAVALTISPDYTATAQVAQPFYTKGAAIPVTGSAVRYNGSVAANEKVEVYIITNGLRRTVTATTNGSGNYTAQFVPMANEAGHYSVGASFPGIGATAEQDAFDILGVRVNNGNIAQFRVLLNDTLKGTLPVQNLSGQTLNVFTLKPVNLPNGAVLQFDTVAAFAGNASVNLGYRVVGTALSAGKNFDVAGLQAVAQQGTVQPVEVFYYCQAPQAYIVADVTKIDAPVSQSKGERLVEVRLVNKGVGASGNLTINLPQVAWLSAVSGTHITNLASGDTALLVLKFQAVEEVPFEFPIDGRIGVLAQNGNSFSIPFVYKRVAESTGSVKVTVTDQFTFYTEGAPNVQGARVQVRNYFTGALLAEGVTNAAGVFEVAGVPEGTHRITVTKDKHETYNNTLTVNPGGSAETTVFLNYQAITFSWNVVPTAVQDVYDITLTTQFETHVPVPVVIIDMPKRMPQLSGSETYAFNVTLTNHGLVAAEDVALNLPQNDPEYEFVTNYVPARLLAQQSIQIPVIMRRRDALRTAASVSGAHSIASISQFLGMDAGQYATIAATTTGSCQEFTNIVYWYKCNFSTGLWQKGGVLFTFDGRSCVPGPTGPWPPGELGGGGGGRVPTQYPPCASCPVICIDCYTPPTPTPEYETGKKSCVECLNDLLGAAGKCLAARGKKLKKVGQYMSAMSCVGDALISGKYKKIKKCSPKKKPKDMDCAKAIVKAMRTCEATETDGGSGPASSGLLMSALSGGSVVLPGVPGGAAFIQIADNLDSSINAYEVRESWAREYYGDMALSEAMEDLDSLIQPYITGLDSIRPGAQTAILAGMTGYEIQPATLQAFFERWNRSVGALNNGVFESNAQYPGIINWNKVEGWSESLTVSHQRAVSMGFASIDSMYEKGLDAVERMVEEQKQAAVCASVKVQFSQQLTMTREAFEGTLEIFNGHPTDAMDSLSVQLQITDANGVPSNGLFQINTKSLTNLGDVTGTGMLAS
ncbi:MBG domain-containing protein, partial [Paraflavisolibacter sp. H34]|uniref:lectin-like domain-containing protein n=1 Tax=Huijunlia imazamoxiresistens TaxID=3127457 RepID=UPI00301B012D